jgi:hypothetical protein
MRHTVGWLAVGLIGLWLSACAAETRPATSVGSTSATLNARGHSDSTPAHYEFQYATSEAGLGTSAGQQTPKRGPIPAHRSASFSESVSGLSSGTTYFFRVCGGDHAVHPDVCDSTRSFTTTVPAAPVAFAPAVTYPVHSAPAALAVANLQGRASRDVVTANPATNDVSVLLNHGDGVFVPAVNYATDQGPLAIAVGNFTGAGRRDVVTANGASDVSVLLGNGHGGLARAVNYTLPGVPQSLVVGDFNGDGHQDIAVFEDLPPTSNPNDPYGNTPAGVVSVLPGRGDGTFGAPVNTTVIPAAPCGVHGVCAKPAGVTLAARALETGNPHLDLVLAGTSTAYDFYVRYAFYNGFQDVLIGNGDGTFAVKSSTQLPPGPQGLGPPENAILGLALGDLSGDGKLDEVYIRADQVLYYNSSGQITGVVPTEIEFAAGNGDGTFGNPTVAATLPNSSGFPAGPGQSPTTDSLRIAAITSAARRDLVSATPQQLTVTPGSGNGTFGAPVAVGGGAVAVGASDLNRDGKVDIVDAPDGLAEVQVLDNATPGG